MNTEKKWKFNKRGTQIANILFGRKKIDKGKYHAGQTIV
jgi:hypothetical protein